MDKRLVMRENGAGDPAAAAGGGWAVSETLRRLRDEDPYRDEPLAPTENFPSQSGWFREGNEWDPPPRKAGEPSRALENLVHGRANGWPHKPGAREVEQSIRKRQRSERADAIACLVVTESSIDGIIMGEMEGAYSLQDLAWWIHALRIPAKPLIHWLNSMQESWNADRERHR